MTDRDLKPEDCDDCPYRAREAELRTALAALLRACAESAYCYVCNAHPPERHKADCLLATEEKP